ncbi:hypothetical protein DEHALATV1_0078 [Dehalococcoides mccartyi]|uniref:Uncharacterized protein n=1 Tax=Dehalococcoides mccartyi TaxID=61435 RepID=A0AB33HMW5_9CHLR|nr:hypothetical protein [Dehalococcoides mccartyi]BAZ96706.1 hypothetical protein DEHALATV1_0078 [Dehalococcoides mccartyi]
MSPQWITWIVFTYLVGQVMCLVLEGTWLGAADQSFLNALLGFTAIEYTDSTIANVGITVVNMVAGAAGFFTYALPRLLLWNYSFLDGSWFLAKLFFLYPISAGTIFGIYTLFRR